MTAAPRSSTSGATTRPPTRRAIASTNRASPGSSPSRKNVVWAPSRAAASSSRTAQRDGARVRRVVEERLARRLEVRGRLAVGHDEEHRLLVGCCRKCRFARSSAWWRLVPFSHMASSAVSSSISMTRRAGRSRSAGGGRPGSGCGSGGAARGRSASSAPSGRPSPSRTRCPQGGQPRHASATRSPRSRRHGCPDEFPCAVCRWARHRSIRGLGCHGPLSGAQDGVGHRARDVPRLGVAERPTHGSRPRLPGRAGLPLVALALAGRHAVGDVPQQCLAELAHRLGRERELPVGGASEVAALAQRPLQLGQGARVDGGLRPELAGELRRGRRRPGGRRGGLGELVGEVVEVGEVLEHAGAVAEAESLLALELLASRPSPRPGATRGGCRRAGRAGP